MLPKSAPHLFTLFLYLPSVPLSAGAGAPGAEITTHLSLSFLATEPLASTTPPLILPGMALRITIPKVLWHLQEAKHEGMRTKMETVCCCPGTYPWVTTALLLLMGLGCSGSYVDNPTSVTTTGKYLLRFLLVLRLSWVLEFCNLICLRSQDNCKYFLFTTLSPFRKLLLRIISLLIYQNAHLLYPVVTFLSFLLLLRHFACFSYRSYYSTEKSNHYLYN